MNKHIFKGSLSKTIIYGILILIFIVGFGSAAIGYIIFTDVIQNQYKDNAKMIANTVANYINPDTLDGYLESKVKDDAYLQTEEVLQTIADNGDCSVIYVAKVNPANRERVYVYNIVSEASGFYPYEIGHKDKLESNFISAYDTINDGEKKENNFAYGKSDVIGAYVTTIVPIKNSSGEMVAVCGIVKTMTSLQEGRKLFLQNIFIWTVLIALIAGTLGILLLRKKIVAPVRRIVSETERFGAVGYRDGIGNISKEITQNDEIGELAAAVDSMEETIITGVKNFVALTAEKNRIGAELDIAQKLQRNVLPKMCETFPGREEIDVFATMNPAKEVGGDYYDCFFIDKDHFAIVIADVAGKGVPAALFMMITKVLLKTIALENLDPASVLEIVNRKICGNNESDMFVTVWLGILDLSTGEIKAANAGHEYPAVYDKNGEYKLLKDKHGFVLGGFETSKYEAYTIQLEPGDSLFVYTDGLPEANNSEGEQFGTDRMLEVLNQNIDASAEELGRDILDKLADFVGEGEQFDDTTFLALKYKGKGDAREEHTDMGTEGAIKAEISNGIKELVLDATVDNIAVVTDFINDALDSADCPNAVKVQFDIVIDELFGNIAQYAYNPEDGEAIVRIDLSKPNEIVLQLSDYGKPFNPLESDDPDVTLSADERSIGGLGVFIAKSYMDDLSYEYEDGKNILTAKKYL